MMKFSKKVYAGDIVSCILLAIILVSFLTVFSKGFGNAQNNMYVKVLSDSKEIYIIPLSESVSDISVNGVHIRVENGRAYIFDSDCPDKTCTEMIGVDKNGGGAVCLPNRIVLEPSKSTGNLHYIIG